MHFDVKIAEPAVGDACSQRTSNPPGEAHERDQGFCIWAAHPGKCLDSSGPTADGTPVQMWDCQPGNRNQIWLIKDGKVMLAARPDKCLDVSAGGTANGTPVQLRDCESMNDNQRWRIR